MMEQRTLNIINICKKNTKYNKYSSTLQNIQDYISEECGIPYEEYDLHDLFNIIKTAFYDYINHCDKPDVILQHIEEFIFRYELALTQLNIIDAICYGFKMANVKKKENNNFYYINGFDERLHLLDMGE